MLGTRKKVETHVVWNAYVIHACARVQQRGTLAPVLAGRVGDHDVWVKAIAGPSATVAEHAVSFACQGITLRSVCKRKQVLRESRILVTAARPARSAKGKIGKRFACSANVCNQTVENNALGFILVKACPDVLLQIAAGLGDAERQDLVDACLFLAEPEGI